MEYVYPAIFHPNSDGSFTVTFPDLPGCITEGTPLDHAFFMAQSALHDWVEYELTQGSPLPPASPVKGMGTKGDEFATLVGTVVRDGGAVRRTVSIPQWMDRQAAEAGLSLSRILQDALAERLSS
jgi:predicted RNase H-like HicB family nuclease